MTILTPIPAATNRFINPSFETSTTAFTSITGVTSGPTLQTGGAFAGDDYIRYVLSSAANGSIGFVQSTHRILVVTNDIIRGGLALKGTAGQTLLLNWAVYNSGSGLLSSQTTYSHVLTAGWQYIVLPEHLITDATAHHARLIITHNNSGVATTVDIDAIDIRVNQPFDNYIDGDQGSVYGWSGTAHASTSYRLEQERDGVVGIGGVLEVWSEVWLSDALGNEYDDLTEYVTDGQVVYDIDRAHKATVSLSVLDTALFQSFQWVKTYQNVRRETEDHIHREPLGLFRLAQPSTSWPDGTGKVSGIDPTIMLAELSTTNTKNIAGGTVITTAIATLLTEAGFGTRYNIPADARTLPTGGKTYPSGTSYLKMINNLLDAISYYTLYPLGDGRVSSKPYMDRLRTDPSHVMTIGQDAEIIGSIEESVSDDNLYNYVIVTKTDQEATVLQSILENQNTAHPYSTVSLGLLAGLPKVYKTKHVEFNDGANQAALDAKARETLERASMTRYLTIETLPDPHHEPHEIASIDASNDPFMDRISGVYYVEYHSFGLVGAAGDITMKLRRIESYE